MNTRIACSLSLGVIIATTACSIFGTEPAGPEREVRVPFGWNLFNFERATYTYGIDHTTKHGGASAGFIQGTDRAETSVVAFMQDLRPDYYLGKRIRWSGWVRTQNVASDLGGGAFLGATVYAYGSRATGNTSQAFGTAGWHQVSVVLDVPTSAIGIRLGAQFQGSGDFLMDDFRLDVVGTDVMTTGSVGPQSENSANLALYYQRMTPDLANLDFEGVSSPTP